MRRLKSEHWLRQAVQFYESGKLAQAEKIARQHFKAEPTAAANLLAGVALKRGDLASAQKFLARALRETPNALPIRMNLINVARQNGDHATVLRHLEFVVANAPGDAETLADLGALYLNLGRVEDAIAALKESEKLRPSPATKELLAEAYMRADRIEEAAALASLAIAGKRETARMHFIVGRSFLEAKKPGAAAESFRQAVEIDPEDHGSLVGLSVATGRNRDILGAKQAARRALELRPFVSIGPSDSALCVAVPQPLPRGYFTRNNLDSGAYSTGNFPSKLRYEDVLFNHYPVDLTSASKALDNHQADLVLNNLVNGDGLQDEKQAAYARRFCESFGVDVVNPPDAAALATRQNNYDRLKEAEFYVYPAIRTYPVIGEDRRSLCDRILHDVGLPAIVRPSESQEGHGAVICVNEDELRKRLDGWSFPDVCAIRYYDCRDERDIAVHYRICVLDGRFYANRRNAAPGWHSHGGDRKKMGWYENGYAEAEERFMTDPASVLGGAPEKVFGPFVERLELDIFGIDFGVDRDGRIIIFEANASMNLSHKKHFEFCPYKVAHEEKFLSDVREYLMRRAGKAGA